MLKRLRVVLLLSLAMIILFNILTISNVKAETLESENYRFTESTLGPGGLIESTSENYQGSNASGDLVVGNATSGNYQIDTGSLTSNDPALSFSVGNANANFGSFSPTQTSTATASFSVSNYTSYGYSVQIIGSPPTDGAHIISPMSENGAPQIGIEQFGINLVANTIPTSFGSNPNNGQFGFGSVATNYATANIYRYVSGEVIAEAPKSSGVTIYTISYIVNVSSLTPGGYYTSDQSIIIVGTY